MDTKKFLAALDEVVKEKGIKKEVILEAMELALVSAYKKNFDQATNVRVTIDNVTGDIHVFKQIEVVEDVFEPLAEMSLEAAKEINPTYVIGDIIEEEVTHSEFGRVAAQTAKQVVLQKIREAEREAILDVYADREGDIMTGMVAREDAKNYYVDLGRSHGILSKNEVIPGERIEMDSRLKVLLSKIEKTSKGPLILLSRRQPGLLRCLLELEVPEIAEGTVELHSVSREAGERSKIAVSSLDVNVDPVGACVGNKGARINAIVNELKGEKIDVVPFDKDPEVYIKNALSPAQVTKVIIQDEKLKKSTVVVPDDQLSLAIGKRGQNARLAARLTNWKIDIKSETDAKELGIEF